MWFVRVGPFGGLFPASLKGLIFMILVIVPLAWGMAYGAKFADANKMGEAVGCWAVCAFVAILAYSFAFRRSRK